MNAAETAMGVVPTIEKLKLRLQTLAVELPANQERIKCMIECARSQGSNPNESNELLTYLEFTLVPAVKAQRNHVSEQTKHQNWLETAEKVVGTQQYRDDLAKEEAAKEMEAKKEEAEAYDNHLKLNAQLMLIKHAGIAGKDLHPSAVQVKLNEYVQNTLEPVKINWCAYMAPLEKCEVGSFVVYEPPRPSYSRQNAGPDRYRALVLQRTTEFGTTNERFVIVYLDSNGRADYDVVSLETLRPVSSDEPEGKRARF